MHLRLIKNPDESQKITYGIARVVYATSDGASSLAAVEAVTSMIQNICVKYMRELDDIISDKNIFECLEDSSPRNEFMRADATSRGFQMCLRVVQKMLCGNLDDMICGATRFHYADCEPAWATSIGYVAQVGDMLFYL